MSDLPNLVFVDPAEVGARWRVVLFGPPGAGKTVAACSAPGPIVAVSADRPGAYRYARSHHTGKRIHEARFAGSQTLRDVYAHVRANENDIETVVLDPFGAMYDDIVEEHTGTSGKPNWQKVNKLVMDTLHAFRALDVHLVLVAHERREQDENGETEPKVFPQLGGPALVQKVMADMDLVARVYRKDQDGESTWIGQFATARGYQCKDSSGALGRTRTVDLTEWFSTATRALAGEPVPWDDGPDADRTSGGRNGADAPDAISNAEGSGAVRPARQQELADA